MKAIRIDSGKPEYVDTLLPSGDGVLVRVLSSSICGSDLHLIEAGWAEGRVLGHEFAGETEDGTAVAVEPIYGCGDCGFCHDGRHSHCVGGAAIVGVSEDGGMAEYVRVPKGLVLPLPSGLDVANASLVEPLAVAVHGLRRARLQANDRVLIIGAGPIGLMAAAVLQARGVAVDLIARHAHQQRAAELLGASPDTGDGYDLVVDAVGSSESLADAVQRIKPLGRIAMLGSFWQPVQLGMGFCGKEIEIIAATTYQRCVSDCWEFREAAEMLAEHPHIADALVTHRYPLEAATEAFAAARDRKSGAIKVLFEP